MTNTSEITDWTILDKDKASLILDEARLYLSETLETQKLYSTRSAYLTSFVIATVAGVLSFIITEARQSSADWTVLAPLIILVLITSYAGVKLYQLFRTKRVYLVGSEPKELLTNEVCNQDAESMIAGIAITYQKNITHNREVNTKAQKLLSEAMNCAFIAPVIAVVIYLLLTVFAWRGWFGLSASL